jgi:hypothetical protein
MESQPPTAPQPPILPFRLLDLSAERLLEASYLPWLAGWEAYAQQQGALSEALTTACEMQRNACLAQGPNSRIALLHEMAVGRLTKRLRHTAKLLQLAVEGPSSKEQARLEKDWAAAAAADADECFKAWSSAKNEEELFGGGSPRRRGSRLLSSSSDEEGDDWGVGRAGRSGRRSVLRHRRSSSSGSGMGSSDLGSDTEVALRDDLDDILSGYGYEVISGSDLQDFSRRMEEKEGAAQQQQQQQKGRNQKGKPSTSGTGGALVTPQQDRATRRLRRLIQRMGLPSAAADTLYQPQLQQQPPQQQQPQQQRKQRQHQHPPASSAASTGAAQGGAVDWSAWVPWFNPGCPLCVQEVQDLMAEQQQQQQQAAAAGGARAEVPLRCRPGYHPWTAGAATTAAAAAAAAAGGNQGPPHPDAINSTTSTASSSSSSSSPGGPWLSSCYGSWPVPWSCAFRYRRLLWRLLARLKPRAAAFYAQQAGMCAHNQDADMWSCVVSKSLVHKQTSDTYVYAACRGAVLDAR